VLLDFFLYDLAKEREASGKWSRIFLYFLKCVCSPNLVDMRACMASVVFSVPTVGTDRILKQGRLHFRTTAHDQLDTKHAACHA
jgi:hypothetical protein